MNIATTPGGPIAVIGAGAAGCLAAISAAERGATVILLERTSDGGRKILISGGGRCNILPGELREQRFVTDSSPHTLKQMLRNWPLADQRRFFEFELALPLVLEPESGKLFPVSNRARDVRDGLVNHARKAGVDLRFGVKVESLSRLNNAWQLDLGGGETLTAQAVVLSTGGLSVPATGSDGWGLGVARALGHTIHPTYAALTPLIAAPAVHAALSGISLPVGLTAAGAGRSAESEGGFLFTHRGYSGPSVLDVAHVLVRARQEHMPATLRVRWGARDERFWQTALLARGAGQINTLLRAELPARLVDRLLLEAGVPSDTSLAQLRKEQRQALIEALVRYPLPVTGDEGYKKAEVTGGGVALAEIDPHSMESRKAPGLYFCGEILDAFGPIGGYNFAWAWATGRAAGIGAAGRDR